jgi:DNA repair exonuclease SbcCD nuclease subunit
MSVTFVHTADWQLGKPFAGIEDPGKRALVQQERLAALSRVAQVAKDHRAQFIVIAGDIFDSHTATKATVSAACAAIGGMNLPVYAIPGNHDYGHTSSLWEQPFFQREQAQLAPNLKLLLKAEPFEIEGAVILPCPLLRRHESVDSTLWLRALGEELKGFSDMARIVLAHGSVLSFGGQTDEEESSVVINHIDLSRLPIYDIDYVALGDWHGTKQVGTKAWYSGTPELDRFPKGEGNEPGNVLVVSVSRGKLPHVTPVRTARIGWHELESEVSHDSGVPDLEATVENLLGNRAQQDLLLLKIQGSVGIEAMMKLDQKLEAWDARLLRLKLSNQTIVSPSEEEIVALSNRSDDPLISRVASNLLLSAQGSDANAAVARVALCELYAACLET